MVFSTIILAPELLPAFVVLGQLRQRCHVLQRGAVVNQSAVRQPGNKIRIMNISLNIHVGKSADRDVIYFSVGVGWKRFVLQQNTLKKLFCAAARRRERMRKVE